MKTEQTAKNTKRVEGAEQMAAEAKVGKQMQTDLACIDSDINDMQLDSAIA